MTWSSILGEMIAGWLLADLLGGVIHWWEDRIASPAWPLIGKLVVAPNRLHHQDPLAFTRSSFITRNSTTWATVLAISAAWFAIAGFSVVWLAATIGGLVSSDVHYWTHRSGHAPAAIAALQRTGLIQSPREHGGHHRSPAGHYCVLTNFLNPMLDGIGLWAAIERVTGVSSTEAIR